MFQFPYENIGLLVKALKTNHLMFLVKDFPADFQQEVHVFFLDNPAWQQGLIGGEDVKTFMRAVGRHFYRMAANYGYKKFGATKGYDFIDTVNSENEIELECHLQRGHASYKHSAPRPRASGASFDRQEITEEEKSLPLKKLMEKYSLSKATASRVRKQGWFSPSQIGKGRKESL